MWFTIASKQEIFKDKCEKQYARAVCKTLQHTTEKIKDLNI